MRHLNTSVHKHSGDIIGSEFHTVEWKCYGCEAWTLTNRDEQYLRKFGCRILGKIFGPVQNEDGSWRIRMNRELNELIKTAGIVRFIKKQKNSLAKSRDADG